MKMKLLPIFITTLLLGCDGGSSSTVQEPSDKIINTLLPVNVAPFNEGDWYRPQPYVTWQWQLLGEINNKYNAEIYDIDLFDSSKNLILDLQSSGKKVICYFSAGSYENWRIDANKFSTNDYRNTLDGWEGEMWLDVRSNNVHKIMKNRLELAYEKGCDGVELDNMDGYVNNSGFNISADEQLAYNRFLANEAHKNGLSVALKNDVGQIVQLVDYYDFAVNEQCFEYDECELMLPFIENNKAVLNAEYKKEYVTDKIKICSTSIDLKFSTLILPLNLDDKFRISCL